MLTRLHVYVSKFGSRIILHYRKQPPFTQSIFIFIFNETACKPEVNNTTLGGTFEHPLQDQPINFSTLFPVISDLKISWNPTA